MLSRWCEGALQICNPHVSFSFFGMPHCSIAPYKHYLLVILEWGLNLRPALFVRSFQEGQKSMTQGSLDFDVFIIK